MAIETDVVVVGGGLAGSAAALAAAHEGAAVRLVSRAESTLRQATGLIDVLGYLPDAQGPVVDPFAAIPDLPAGHPYERVGSEAVREGLALFDDVVGDAYAGGHADANALVPTHAGTVKPTARYPASVAPGLASDDRSALLVGFDGVPALDASLVAAGLSDAGVPFDVTGVAVAFPGDFRADAPLTRYAEALDRDERVDGRGTRTALAEAVAPHLDGAERVGFPAVLGLDDPEGVRAALADALGVPVFEVPTGLPSVPGRRLEVSLRDALADAGVEVALGVPVVGYESDGDQVAAVVSDHDGRRVDCRAGGVVLATGGLVGGGVETDREAVREPVFDCHVPRPSDRYDWSDAEPFGDHAFARFGVEVDRSLRPQTAAGDPEFANLHAAGAVLGGCDLAAEKSGSGVSLATGVVAGRAAARSAEVVA